MKKKIIGFGMMVILTLGMSMGICAADEKVPTAVFDGSSEIKYNYDVDGNFGSAFEGMLPGDERTQQIILKNTYEKPVDFYMEVDVIKALEEAGAADAAYQFSLSVTQDSVNNGEPQIIYGGADNEDAWIGGEDSNGLGDINDVLAEYGENGIKVATLQQNEEAVISLSVTLDGITAGNTYQDVDGTFQFAFHASYDTNDPGTITETVKGKDNIVTKQVRGEDKVIVRENGSLVDRVKTGDPAVIFPIVIVMAVCAAAIILIIAKRKHRTEER